MDNNNTQLTDEQVEMINNELEDYRNNTEDLKVLADLPSNDGVEESATVTTGEYKTMNVSVNPDTGEHFIYGEAEQENQSFEDLCDEINSTTLLTDKDAPVDEGDLKAYAESVKDDKDSLFKEIFGGEDNYNPEVMTKLLEVTNRRINKEKFNVFRELPESVQQLINKTVIGMGVPITSNQYRTMRNAMAESLVDEFITDTYFNRAKNDLNKEIENIFNEGSADIANTVIGYTADRNQALREYAEKIDDPEKKEKILSVLERIEEAYNLTELKEYCKKFKVKHIDIEKLDSRNYRIDGFLSKYDNSPYNIYSIYTAEKSLLRNINKDMPSTEQYNAKQIRAFFLAFCDQVKNYTPEDSLQHAYMYYVIYNTVLSDINTGDKKEISDIFLNNVRECIDNLRTRNSYTLD